MINSIPKFILTAPLSSFPSDNALDAMPRQQRIAIKKSLKQEAQILTLQWLRGNKIKPSSIGKEKPLFPCCVRLVLCVYLKTGSTIDIHNLSIKHFLDQIVSMGIVKDDSVREIPECKAVFGGWVKEKSYAEFSLEEI
jgi:hypothetical protein